jgi:hypothetical protein
MNKHSKLVIQAILVNSLTQLLFGIISLFVVDVGTIFIILLGALVALIFEMTIFVNLSNKLK